MQLSSTQFSYRSQNVGQLSFEDRADEYFFASQLLRREQTAFSNSSDRATAAAMRHPVSLERAFAIFGMALGLFPLTAMILRVALQTSNVATADLGFLALFLLATIATATAGFFSGSRAARAEAWAAKKRVSVYVSILPIIGIIWGAVCGFAGGLFILLIGAFFGSFIGAAAAGLTFPLFALAVRSVAIGDQIDQRHLLPILFGTVGIPTSIFLGA